MKDSKIRRTLESSNGDSKYQNSSSQSTKSQQSDGAAERFILSVQQKELSAAKRQYVESTQTKPGAPFAGAQPKGMYFERGTGVVDDYAKQTNWRERIQKALAESEGRAKEPPKEHAPWPDQNKPFHQERVFEKPKPAKAKQDDFLWEIDEKITAKPKPISKEQEPALKTEIQQAPTFESEEKKAARAKAHTQWLAERNAKIKDEEEELVQTVAAKQKKMQRAEAHEKWLAEREARIAAEDEKLKKDVAANQKKQKYAEAHEKWLAEREARIAAEDEQLKKDVAANLKKKKYAEAHRKWIAEREARIAAEDEKLKKDVAAKLKKKKYAEAHEKWLAEREAKIAAEEEQLKKDAAAELKKKKYAEEHRKWLAEREAKIIADDEKLKNNVVANLLRVEAASVSEEPKYEFKEVEDEFEVVYDETVTEIFEQAIENDEAVIEIYEEIKPESIAEERAEVDEGYDADIQALLNEKKNLEKMRAKRASAQNLDDEFVV